MCTSFAGKRFCHFFFGRSYKREWKIHLQHHNCILTRQCEKEKYFCGRVRTNHILCCLPSILYHLSVATLVEQWVRRRRRLFFPIFLDAKNYYRRTEKTKVNQK